MNGTSRNAVGLDDGTSRNVVEHDETFQNVM